MRLTIDKYTSCANAGGFIGRFTPTDVDKLGGESKQSGRASINVDSNLPQFDDLSSSLRETFCHFSGMLGRLFWVCHTICGLEGPQHFRGVGQNLGRPRDLEFGRASIVLDGRSEIWWICTKQRPAGDV